MPNPSPKEDQWAYNLIETPFPDNPVKVFGEQNQYVALWYKHGKPCHGRAWNDGGIVKCSFPYPLSKLELTEKRDLGGEIQILQYKGDHLSLGYWYNWIKFAERPLEDDPKRQLVRCGASIPILWADRKEGALLGFLNPETETANFAVGGKCVMKKGDELKTMMFIVRELVGGPPTCECSECKFQPKPVVRIMLNEWSDFRAGDPFPRTKCVQALFRPLNTLPGENPEQFVALWYQSGEPVMGRIYKDSRGKIAANFGWFGNEYKTNIGSIQVLFELPEHVRGFDYAWKEFPEAAKFGEKEWIPVHIDHHKGNISPGVLMIDGKEVLGKARFNRLWWH